MGPPHDRRRYREGGAISIVLLCTGLADDRFVGMVLPMWDTLIMFFLASSMPLRMASGTSALRTVSRPALAVADHHQGGELHDTTNLTVWKRDW